MIIKYIKNDEEIYSSIIVGSLFSTVCFLLFLNYPHILGVIIAISGSLFFGFIDSILSSKIKLLYLTLISSIITLSILESIWSEFQYPLWLCILIIIVITEILFLLNKTKPCIEDNIMWFTTKLKIEAFFEAIFVFLFGKTIYEILISQNYAMLYPHVLEFINIIIIILSAIILIYGYIWINSRRYKAKNE